MNSDEEERRQFSVVYAKVSSRKHKKWEGDGLLVCSSQCAVLQTEDSSEIARSSSISRKKLADIDDGVRLFVGPFEVEVQCELKRSQFVQIEPSRSCEPSSSVARDEHLGEEVEKPKLREPLRKVARKFVRPLMDTDCDNVDTQRFIINSEEVEARTSKEVVLDGRFVKYLRPHQLDGIAFLYKKLKEIGGGAILADEMGLGKSVQTIAVMRVLLRGDGQQRTNPRRSLLVVPSSLIANWQCEFVKWIPNSASLLYRVAGEKELDSYLHASRCAPIALMSYEMCARLEEKLTRVPFTLVVCDEAHRLKNINGRLRRTIELLNAERRLLLTGTPLQNDSDEFFSLLDLVRPGLFGSLTEFKKMLKDDSEAQTLHALIADVMLRRTAEVNRSYLPPKHEYVLWCRPSDLQFKIYSAVLDSITSDDLTVIDMLRKLCNHPAILFLAAQSHVNSTTNFDKVYDRILQSFGDYGNRGLLVHDSGKLAVFMQLLVAFWKTNESVVVVSNFTKTLDMLQNLCEHLYFKVCRLDGSVVQQKRIQIVNEFNTSEDSHRVFLLSTKAGGVGLNLTGASRLILFDSDWNPATDVQAMARIWRDGQLDACHIFRLLTAGTIEEKIFQRQVKKSGLSWIVEADLLAEPLKFSEEDLKDIFTLGDGNRCGTHDLLECSCNGCGLLPFEMGSVDGEIQAVPGIEDIEEMESDNGALTIEEVAGQGGCGEGGTSTSVSHDGNVGSISLMAALQRWHHYSPEKVEQFEAFQADAGLSACDLSEVVFAMRLTCNY